MSIENDARDFVIPTSREYLVDKTIEEIKKHTYINPLFDAGFKAFLCDEDALVNFLNGVFHLNESNRIESVVIKNVDINIIFANVEILQGSQLGGTVAIISGERENVITATLPCTVTLRYRPILKDTI